MNCKDCEHLMLQSDGAYSEYGVIGYCKRLSWNDGCNPAHPKHDETKASILGDYCEPLIVKDGFFCAYFERKQES